MAPEYLEISLGNSDYESQFVGPPTVIVEHSFLMVVTAHRIMTACRQRGVLPSPDQLPSLTPVWKSFYHHMACSLDKVNRQLASPEPDTGVFYRIMDILHVEVRPSALPLGGLLEEDRGDPAEQIADSCS